MIHKIDVLSQQRSEFLNDSLVDRLYQGGYWYTRQRVHSHEEKQGIGIVKLNRVFNKRRSTFCCLNFQWDLHSAKTACTLCAIYLQSNLCSRYCCRACQAGKQSVHCLLSTLFCRPSHAHVHALPHTLSSQDAKHVLNSSPVQRRHPHPHTWQAGDTTHTGTVPVQAAAICPKKRLTGAPHLPIIVCVCSQQ